MTKAKKEKKEAGTNSAGVKVLNLTLPATAPEATAQEHPQEELTLRSLLDPDALNALNDGRWRGLSRGDTLFNHLFNDGFSPSKQATMADVDAVFDRKPDGDAGMTCALGDQCTGNKAYKFQPTSYNVLRHNGTVVVHEKGKIAGTPVRMGQYFVRADGVKVGPVCLKDRDGYFDLKRGEKGERVPGLRDRGVKFYDSEGADRVAFAINATAERTAKQASGLDDVAAGAIVRDKSYRYTGLGSPKTERSGRNSRWQ